MMTRTVIGALLAACAALAQQTRISGQVVDIAGAAIPKATVTLTAADALRRTTTNDSGLFKFSSVIPQKYELRITSPGFAEGRQVVVAASGTGLDLGRIGLGVGEVICNLPIIPKLPLNFGQTPIERQIFISGQVAAHSIFGTPVANATVTLRRSSVSTATVTTGADGTFNFPFAPVGDYEMQVQAKNFRPQTIRLSATSPDEGYVGTIVLAAN
jgi:hypothetical protein